MSGVQDMKYNMERDHEISLIITVLQISVFVFPYRFIIYIFFRFQCGKEICLLMSTVVTTNVHLIKIILIFSVLECAKKKKKI